MSESSTTVAPPPAPHDDHGHAHPEYLQHHFDTPLQQFDSAKLGMWLFLATEILLFGGLFCAYAILRANHPEMFLEGHKLLDKNMGALNTVVLLVSSFTMAWGVRAAQKSQTKLLIGLLSFTFLCGAAFMVVKYIEYSAKFDHRSLWGAKFDPGTVYGGDHGVGHGSTTTAPGAAHVPAAGSGEAPIPAGAVTIAPKAGGAADHGASAGEHAATPPSTHGVAAATSPAGAADTAGPPDAWKAPPLGSVATRPIVVEEHNVAHSGGHELPSPTHNLHIFFGLYFCMTGLHGLHVLAGMSVIAWLIFRSVRGDFSSEYFTPVDLGGLYWHLVDLIWIYLFPLLYLIH